MLPTSRVCSNCLAGAQTCIVVNATGRHFWGLLQPFCWLLILTHKLSDPSRPPLGRAAMHSCVSRGKGSSFALSSWPVCLKEPVAVHFNANHESYPGLSLILKMLTPLQLHIPPVSPVHSLSCVHWYREELLCWFPTEGLRVLRWMHIGIVDFHSGSVICGEEECLKSAKRSL